MAKCVADLRKHTSVVHHVTVVVAVCPRFCDQSVTNERVSADRPNRRVDPFPLVAQARGGVRARGVARRERSVVDVLYRRRGAREDRGEGERHHDEDREYYPYEVHGAARSSVHGSRNVAALGANVHVQFGIPAWMVSSSSSTKSGGAESIPAMSPT